MIGFQIFRNIPTSLEINGPILSFSQQPVDITTNSGGSISLTGIATAQFPSQTPPNSAENSGYISYRWYEDGVGVLSNTSTITGTATTILTLSNLSNPIDNGRRFYLRADYMASAYGIGKSTPNAINDPLDSNIVSITVRPTISIVSQPISSTVSQNRLITFNTIVAVSDDSEYNLLYQWYLNGSPLIDGATIRGATTNSLTISLSNVSTNTVYVEVSHLSAGNSPIVSNIATYNVISAESITRSMLNYEIVRDDNSILYSTGEQNIYTSPLTFSSDLNNPSRSIVVYPPEKDIYVKITLAAAAGQSFEDNLGGAGGLSSFTYILRKNTEYVFKLNPSTEPFGGTGGGGGSALFYEKARLLAVCGGGGGASSGGKGGDGGGVGVAGQNGAGRSAGLGGYLVNPGGLNALGLSSNGTIGGRIESCTIGTYYRINGYSPCSDIGIDIPWRDSSGTASSNQNGTVTATIIRGYKAGTSYRNNGGKSLSQENGIFVGGGGSGTVGGNAAQAPGSSGGGGSGYTNGSVSIISTQLGGNASTNSFVTIEIQA